MDKLTVFIALTGIAVALQAGVLVAIYIAMRKSSERMAELATDMKTKFMPTVEQAQEMMTLMRPRLEVIVENVEGATTVLRSQVERVDATVNDVIDRARLQIIRGDELLTRTMDRVEQTSEIVQKTVVSPVRQLSGLMQGISVALEFLFGGHGRRNGGSRERRPVPQDEMFI
jgi:chemotaxis regulatin CheY-phosphate phosphatase CheZ